MSLFWPTIIITCVIITVLFEVSVFTKEKKIRSFLKQSKVGRDKIRSRLGHALFLTTILLEISSLILVGGYKQWFYPLQGVAIVVNTSTEESKPHLIGIEKSVVSDLIQSLPDVSLSLYQVTGGVTHMIVPPTVDRLYFELQLSGLQASPPVISPLNLSTIQRNISRSQSSQIPPWIVFVSSTNWAQNGPSGDGLTTIRVCDQNVTCTFFEGGFSSSSEDITEASSRISQRLNRSVAPSQFDTTAKSMLIAATWISLLCYLGWRLIVPPIALLTLFFALPVAPLICIDEAEANVKVQGAIDLERAGDVNASVKTIESLLTSIANPVARQRLLFNRALLSYIQGQDEKALEWLSMESETGAEPKEQRQTLQGLILTRLFLSSTDAESFAHHKQALLSWIRSSPRVDSRVILSAKLALLSPPLAIEKKIFQYTLSWLQEQEEDGGGKDLTQAAALLTTSLDNQVSQALHNHWGEVLARRFDQEVRHNGSVPVEIRAVWYTLVDQSSPEERIQALLNSASEAANESIFFPNPQSQQTLLLVTSLLSELPLPQPIRPLFEKIMASHNKSATDCGAIWYVRASLWTALHKSSTSLAPLVKALSAASETHSNERVRQEFANLVLQTISLPRSTQKNENQLEDVLQRVLTLLYSKDPMEALDIVLYNYPQNPHLWQPRLTRLLQDQIPKYPSEQGSNADLVGSAFLHDTESNCWIFGRLWQIAINPMSSHQDISQTIDHLIQTYDVLQSDKPPETVISLLCSMEPALFMQLRDNDIFRKKLAKRAVYDQLLQEWNDSSHILKKIVSGTETLRGEKMEQELLTSEGILKKIQKLLSENEFITATMNQKTGEETTSFSTQQEDAIHLFQEMDRADRELK